MFVVIAAIIGVNDWMRGESLHSYELDVWWLFLCFLAIGIVNMVQGEFRIRTNAIYGRVREIEDRLGAIERELRSLRQEK